MPCPFWHRALPVEQLPLEKHMPSFFPTWEWSWGATAIQAPQTQLGGVMLLPEQLGLLALIQVCCFSWRLLGTVWDFVEPAGHWGGNV